MQTPSGITLSHYPLSAFYANPVPEKPDIWLSIETRVMKGQLELRLQEGQAVTVARYGRLWPSRSHSVKIVATTSLTQTDGIAEAAYTARGTDVQLIDVDKLKEGRAFELPDEQQDLLDAPLSGQSMRLEMKIAGPLGLCVPTQYGRQSPAWKIQPLTATSWVRTHGAMHKAPDGDVAILPQLLGVVKKGSASVVDIMSGKIVEVIPLPLPLACAPAESFLQIETLVDLVKADWVKKVKKVCLQHRVVDVMIGYASSRANSIEVESSDPVGLLRYRLPSISEYTRTQSLVGNSRALIESLMSGL